MELEGKNKRSFTMDIFFTPPRSGILISQQHFLSSQQQPIIVSCNNCSHKIVVCSSSRICVGALDVLLSFRYLISECYFLKWPQEIEAFQKIAANQRANRRTGICLVKHFKVVTLIFFIGQWNNMPEIRNSHRY